MVYNKIHKHFHTPAVAVLKNHLEIIKGAVLGVDVFVIGNIVAVIAVRSRIDR